ncbi:multiple monosaccharide ABC transporter permease [Luteococcus sp. OSA5]|uniref:multiple monosaccharide ABC transporter permease n=1 Tax=Luteococcus sp. OSA5 TaxID=3401630 RepID=UPI003B432C6D
MSENTTTQAEGRRNPFGSMNLRESGLVIALVGIVALFQVLTSGRLMVPDNIASLIQQNAYVMILAIGMMLVIVAGHIDLSVGSIVAMVGGVVGIAIINWGLPWPVAILLALAVGMLVGAWQGFWVAYMGIPAFIVTLGGMLIFRGFAQLLVGQTISGFPKDFITIGNGALPNVLGFTNTPSIGYIDGVTLLIGLVATAAFIWSSLRQRAAVRRNGQVVSAPGLFWARTVAIALVMLGVTYLLGLSTGGFPIVLVIVGVLVVAFSYMLKNTRFGRNIYALGGNARAAELSGVNVKKDVFWVFVLMGVLSALAGVVVTSRAGAAVAAAGTSYELDAIAACFIGGAAVTGGVGKISGAMLGALVMGVLNIGLSIMAVDPAWQMAIKGFVLLAAVAFDLVNKRKAGSTV